MNRTVVAVMLAGAFFALPTVCLAASKIGVAGLVQNQVSASSGSATRALGIGGDVFAGDRIRTGLASNTQLMFLDQTNLTVGAQSDVVLDRFVFDPARGVGDVALSTTQGALRFISGSQNPAAYRIDTPLATIAIRGTLAYSFIYGNAQYVVNGFGHISAIIKPAGNTIDIPQGFALVVLPGNPPQTKLVKWNVGLLDLDQLAQILPTFLDLPDAGADLNDQRNDRNLPPVLHGD